MKFLLKLLVAIASLLGIVLIIALFVDRSIEVKRSETIPVNRQITFDYFMDLEHQKDFNSWLSYDSNTEIWFKGTPGEVGYTMHWNSTDQRVGTGKQELVSIEEYQSIQYKIEMQEPQEIQGDLIISFEDADDNKTKVTWLLRGEIPYPWNLSLLIKDIEGQIGLEMEKGLKKAVPLIENSAG